MINNYIKCWFFWHVVHIFIFNYTYDRLYLRVAKRCTRVRLKVNRKSFFMDILNSLYKKFIVSVASKNNERNTLYLTLKSEHFLSFVENLKTFSLSQFKILNDICAIDHLDRKNRFELSYNLLSIKYNFRLILKIYTNNYAFSLTSFL